MGLLGKARRVQSGDSEQSQKKKVGLLGRARSLKSGQSPRRGLFGLLARASSLKTEKKKESAELVVSSSAPEPDTLAQVQNVLDRKILDLANIFEISKEINATLNIDELITILLFTSMGQMGVSAVALFAADEVGGFCLRGQKGLDGILAQDAIFEVDESLRAFFQEHGKPTSLDELSGKMQPAGAEMLSGASIQLVVPLINKDILTGFLLLGKKYDASPFSNEERDFLTTLAAMAAIAIENARLYTNLEQKLNQLSALYEISCIINSSGELDEVLQLSGETLATGFGLEQAAFIAISTEQCELLQTIGLTEFSAQKFAMTADPAFFAGLVEAGEAMEFPDFNQQAEICNAFDEEDLSCFQSALFIPLVAAGDKLGLLAIFSIAGRGKRPFSKEEKELYSIIASQLAPPIKMASMFAQAKRETADPFHPYLERLNQEFSNAVGFGLSLGVSEIVIDNISLAAAGEAETIEGLIEQVGDKLRAVVDQKYSVVRTGALTFSLLLPGVSLDEQESVVASVKEVLAEVLPGVDAAVYNFQLPEDYKDPASFIFQRI